MKKKTVLIELLLLLQMNSFRNRDLQMTILYKIFPKDKNYYPPLIFSNFLFEYHNNKYKINNEKIYMNCLKIFYP